MTNSPKTNDRENHPLKQFFISENEKAERALILENRISSLRKICEELNPFGNVEQEIKDQLKAFGIVHFDDPFQLTNRLILLMEDSIQELQELQGLQELKSRIPTNAPMSNSRTQSKS